MKKLITWVIALLVIAAVAVGGYYLIDRNSVRDQRSETQEYFAASILRRLARPRD